MPILIRLVLGMVPLERWQEQIVTLHASNVPYFYMYVKQYLCKGTYYE